MVGIEFGRIGAMELRFFFFFFLLCLPLFSSVIDGGYVRSVCVCGCGCVFGIVFGFGFRNDYWVGCSRIWVLLLHCVYYYSSGGEILHQLHYLKVAVYLDRNHDVV